MRFPLLLSLCAAALCSAAAAQSKTDRAAIDRAARQTALLVKATDEQVEKTGKIPSPRTTPTGKNETRYTSLEDWTSGFFPGSLWYLYELTGDPQWKTSAVKYTEGMERIKHYTGNHDVGFMIFCSFGNALRLAPKEEYKGVIATAANSLMSRYKPQIGVIQSWNANKSRGWECPVIIDNMMNLELLFEATKLTGDSAYWHAATSHADRTMENHYRADGSTWHVVDYNPARRDAINGRYTAQGYADSSAWSRGQAWGLYGYTLCYRYTRDPKYLAQADRIAAYILDHPKRPADGIPLWDYDAKEPAAEGRYADRLTFNPRDASAAAITASALYELARYSSHKAKYLKEADRIVAALSSDAYLAKEGENGLFVLMHSTGSIPHRSEIDVPLVYADYYFLEALKRKNDKR